MSASFRRRRAARPRATPFAQQHLKLHGPPNSGRSVAEWDPSLKKATDACVLASNNASPAQRGPRRNAQPTTAPRHAACGGPIPSSRGKFYLILPMTAFDGRVGHPPLSLCLSHRPPSQRWAEVATHRWTRPPSASSLASAHSLFFVSVFEYGSIRQCFGQRGRKAHHA